MSFLWSLASFIVVIGVLVFVHEYGHFWAARKCGVKIHRFSIGFGKVLWSRKDKYETEFAVSMIPLGGYVKMLDERNETVPPELKSQAFNSKTVLQRAFIIIAGPLANFLFAIFAYWVIYLAGIPSVLPVIAEVRPNSIAAQAQIQPNMQIIAVDGEATPDWESINLQLATKIGSAQVTLTMKSFDDNVQQVKTLNLSDWRFNPENESAFGSLGIKPVGGRVEMKISKLIENSPAQKAGLQIGDQIFGSDGEPIEWETFINNIQKGDVLKLVIEREGQTFPLALKPELNEKDKWFVGIAPTFHEVAEKYRTELKYDMLEALQKGVEKTFQLAWLTVKVIGKLFTGDLSLTNLSGPISIAKGAGVSSQIGLVYYLSFMALISVNLGIMNLFPLPVLDGGHLVFLAAEGIMRKPLSEKIQEVSYRIGATLLLMLTLFALFNDFARL